MLSSASVESLLKPISDSSPSGEDLEYDPAFMALEADARPKAEQQFGDTVIAAVEPEWRTLAGATNELLARSKDVRVAMLALRAATRTQGIAGLTLGLSLLIELLERFWDTIHPQLDADDNNDPTMRINALAPLSDADMVLRDVYECQVGVSRTVGPIKVRDIAIANNKLGASSSDPNYTLGQLQGAMQDIFADQPQTIEAGINAAVLAQKLETLIETKTGRADLIELKPLRNITHMLRQACQAVSGADTEGSDGQALDASGEGAATGAGGSGGGGVRGEINTRQDALLVLDKVIAYLERTEPGNPAPLLIHRAKRLVGVSFMSIMEDLAPDAINSIQNITGKPSS
jgi:type VI secretion system protein ImpA